MTGGRGGAVVGAVGAVVGAGAAVVGLTAGVVGVVAGLVVETGRVTVGRGADEADVPAVAADTWAGTAAAGGCGPPSNIVSVTKAANATTGMTGVE